MPRRKLRESLTARIFGITAAMLLAAGAVTFALIAWATPLTYTAVVTDEFAKGGRPPGRPALPGEF